MSRRKGNIAEDNAVDFLLKNGYEVTERNFYSRFGEIDIIATCSGTIHFIEVKSSTSYEVALENITKSKLQKFIRTMNVYLKKHKIDSDYQIDAIIVTPNECEMIENITI
ncbi:MAG: YraN family protein [Campylobacterota bacterium]|nr:YraN family protein [Campylobacterota bacterium]